MENAKTIRKVLTRVAMLAASLFLATTFVVSGLFVCCLPQTTASLSRAFSGIDNPDTPFTADQLVYAAVETRDYTVGSNDRESLVGMLVAINKEAKTRYTDETAVLNAPDTYSLDTEAISHLNDVYRVISQALDLFSLVVIVTIVVSIALGICGGKRLLGQAFRIAGIAVIAILVPLALWAVVDFNSMFAVMHSLFFADGTWTFSYESLLITMYPIAFWMGMGVVWLATTVGLSILAIVAGTLLRRPANNKTD